MKKVIFLSLLAFTISQAAWSQADTYFTSGGEMIFSFATLDVEGADLQNIMRWAPVINMQGMYNVDFSDNFGFFAGLAVRNVGYIVDDWPSIADDGTTPITVKKKFRTYNAGIPVGLKIGNMDKFFIYGGYEVEFPFHYKEKTFQDEKKDKFTVWFSDRVEQFQHGFLVGIQMPWGSNIKFKYYLSEFHNQDYTESSGNMPYKGLKTNIFYISLNYNLFKNTDFYHKDGASKEYY